MISMNQSSQTKTNITSILKNCENTVNIAMNPAPKTLTNKKNTNSNLKKKMHLRKP